MSSEMQPERAIGGLRQSEAKVASVVAEDWKIFYNLAPLLTYPAAIELFTQGSPSQDVYLIEQGLVKLVRLETDGQELIVGLRFPRWLVGAAGAIIQKECPVTAVTLTRCRLRRILAKTFLDILQTDVQLSWYVHQMHSREIFDHVMREAQLGCIPARHRLEQLLWQLISALELNEPQKEIRLQLPLKQWEMAELIAVTPAYLSRLLNELEQDGILRRREGWLIISDFQQLWHTSDC